MMQDAFVCVAEKLDHFTNQAFTFFLLEAELFQELGLVAGTPVGTSLIDAHAGGVGVMESLPKSVTETKGCFICLVNFEAYSLILIKFNY